MGGDVTFPISEYFFKLTDFGKAKSEIFPFPKSVFRTGALGSPLFIRIKMH
jgi:hypothetical protein